MNSLKDELSLILLALHNMLLQILVIHEKTKIIYKYGIAVAVVTFSTYFSMIDQ